MLELPWSDDISRPLTCIHSRSERWISGQSLRHDSPSWPADMHIIRGGGLGWAETWSWAPLSESSQPLAEPGLGARTACQVERMRENLITTQRAREQVGARLWLHFLNASAGTCIIRTLECLAT
jgi:hypothetical protein